LFTRIQYAGSRLRSRVPFVSGAAPPKAAVNLAGFTRECIRQAGERSLDQRQKALAHKLLVEADRHGYPSDLLPGPVNGAATAPNWRDRFETAMNDSLSAVEQLWTKPSGPRAWVGSILVRFANIAPELTLVASILVILWGVLVDRSMQPTFFLLVLPFFLTLLVLILLQLLTNLLLPLRWPSIRSEFRRQLVKRLRGLLSDTYLPIPGDVAESLAAERDRIAKMRSEAGEVGRFLERQRQAATVESLYGA
jgi:hypothetical protein